MEHIAKKFFRHYQRDEIRRLIVLFAMLVSAVGILLSYIFANTIMQQHIDSFHETADRQSSTIAQHLTTQADRYQQLLYAGAGLFDVNGDVTKDQWQQFVTSNRLVERYPSILGYGYASYAGTDAAARTSIVYLEPDNAINQRAIGYDMLSEATRRAAMERARDEAAIAMSAPVRLVQDAGDTSKRGVLIYYPIYDLTKPRSSITERRQAIRGYVYIAMRPVDMMFTLDRATLDIDHISYGIADGNEVIARQPSPVREATDEGHDTSRTIDLYGRTWQLSTTLYQPIWSRLTPSLVIFMTGIIASTLLGFAIHRLLSRSIHRLTLSHREQLMKTRDELLALTSHQLRTPASGVKQYLGMLTQGFVGELTPQQQTIAMKAYSANERQIETINQILHVAKADAGQLSLNHQVVDLAMLVRDVVEGMDEDAKRKSISIRVASPAHIIIKADERYVRMVIENLINNAIKYSYQDSRVRVSCRVSGDQVRVSVSDHGVGLRPEDHDKLFVKFSRVANDLSAHEGGSGLGLYLAQQIALAHGGIIRAASGQKGGAVFTLILPVATHKKVYNKEKI